MSEQSPDVAIVGEQGPELVSIGLTATADAVVTHADGTTDEAIDSGEGEA